MSWVRRPENHNPGNPDAVGRADASPPKSGTRAGPVDLSAAVRGAQSGDEQSFRILFESLQPGLLRYLCVLVGEDAEDVASETWLQISRDLHAFAGDSDGFRGWIATVGRNRAMDHLRQQRRRPRGDVPVEYLIGLPGREDPAGDAMSRISTRTALGLIARLPRDQAEAVLLRVVMDLDADSAARVLGKRSGAVRMAAHRGLRKLAKMLDGSGLGTGTEAAPSAPPAPGPGAAPPPAPGQRAAPPPAPGPGAAPPPAPGRGAAPPPAPGRSAAPPPGQRAAPPPDKPDQAAFRRGVTRTDQSTLKDTR
jgi:RNA polymerase sigma-70 factor, ECF subfamily